MLLRSDPRRVQADRGESVLMDLDLTTMINVFRTENVHLDTEDLTMMKLVHAIKRAT
jgi:hypothetical protein